MFDLKKRYYFRHETPLSFHNLLHFIGLPFSMLVDLADAFRVYDVYCMDPRISTPILLMGGLIAVHMGLCIAAFIGLFRFTKYSFVCLHILYWVNFLLLVPSSEMVSVVVNLIWCIIVTVYYHKRKPLFFPELIPDELMLPDDEDGHIEIGEE